MPEPRPKLLILGGTSEGAKLAIDAMARFGTRLTIVSSLAGRTAMPATIPGEQRRGGFGGADGLADYLAAERITALIDATHPFAATISRHAIEACHSSGVPYLALRRPAWPVSEGENRIAVSDMAIAAAKLAEIGAKRIFVTTGARGLDPLAKRADAWCLVRLIEPPAEPLPLPRHALIFARGPFTESAERKLMADHGIDALLTKDSGGDATFGKILAARDLRLPVVLIARPATESADAVETIEAALDWLDARIRSS